MEATVTVAQPGPADLLPLRPHTLLVAAGLLTLTWFAYLPALHGRPIWDDGFMLTQSRLLPGPHALDKIWFNLHAVPAYYPLTFTALWLQLHLWGLPDLAGYHAVNIVLHGLNALLVWRLMVRLRIRGSVLVAALFAVNPIMVESVAWVTELKNTLSGGFALLAVLAFVRPSWTSAVASILLYSAAMLAKTAVVGLPVTLLVILWWKRRRPSPAQWAAVLMMLLIGGGLSLITRWMESHVVGASGPEFERTAVQRLSVFGPAVLFYIRKLLWPTHISFLYPLWILPDHLAWQHAVGLLVLGMIVVLWIGRSTWGRGPGAAVLVFLILLLPVLGPFTFYFQRYSFVANHFVYLAAIPIFALFAAVIEQTGHAAVPLAAAAVAGCFVLTWQRSHDFVSESAAFHHVIDEDPGNWQANNSIGNQLLQAGRYDDAEPFFRRAADTYPQGGEIWVNLGQIAEHRKQYDSALSDYRLAVQWRPLSPVAHFDLANTLLVYRQLPAAIDEYRTAIDLEPTFAAAHDNLGVAFQKAGDPTDAEGEFETALSLQPDFPRARQHLTNLHRSPAGNAGHDAG